MKSKKLESHCQLIQGGCEAENDDKDNDNDGSHKDLVVDAVKNKDFDVDEVDVVDTVRYLLLIRLGTAPLGSDLL